MQPAPDLANELDRLKALRSLEILDSPAEERFDRITRLASAIFDVPISLVSFVDADRQWFKSRYGLQTTETPRDVSFCSHAIVDEHPLVVRDSLRDDRFAGNPLVTGTPNIRFYAGQPLKAINGSLVGTLCVIDQRPRECTERQLASLRDLACIVERELHDLDLSNLHARLMESRDLERKARNELTLAKQHADVAGRAKSQFLANISHEIPHSHERHHGDDRIGSGHRAFRASTGVLGHRAAVKRIAPQHHQ